MKEILISTQICTKCQRNLNSSWNCMIRESYDLWRISVIKIAILFILVFPCCCCCFFEKHTAPGAHSFFFFFFFFFFLRFWSRLMVPVQYGSGPLGPYGLRPFIIWENFCFKSNMLQDHIRKIHCSRSMFDFKKKILKHAPGIRLL